MLAQKNPRIARAVSRLAELSQDERTRLLAESREKLQWDIAVREREAAREAWKGGEKKAQLAIARKLLGRGYPIEEIVEDTGLTYEEIQFLRIHMSTIA
jgi:predicted transposase/invertase (TIGR01784 family)